MYLELIIRRLITVCMAIAILGSTWAIPAQAQITLPVPGQMVGLSPSVNPTVLRGIKVFADKPFAFDFILTNSVIPVQTGIQKRINSDMDPRLHGDDKETIKRLIRYFLAGLTIPEGDLWVNLSPYEKNRIIPNEFGQTEMGRDLLAQDYILKQITAALMHPENPTGKQFWAKIYAQAQAKFGTTQIPVNTFNKVWIVPEQAEIYEGPTTNGQATAYVTKAKLKVMLEEDYLSMSHNVGAIRESPNQINFKIIQEVIIPVLEQEINQGQNFAQLRQIYYSLILATWYKKFAKGESASGGKAGIIAKQYVDQKKTNKETSLKSIDHIYQQYLKSFKKGAYNFIKVENDPITGQSIPRKYFSGGAQMGKINLSSAMTAPTTPDHAEIIHVQTRGMDSAMKTVTIRQSGKERNKEVFKMATSRVFLERTKTSLKTGKHTIMVVGPGVYPYEPLMLKEELKKFGNSDIEVVTTELKHSAPLAHIRKKGLMNQHRVTLFNVIKNLGYNIENLESINDFFMVVNDAYEATELVIGYKVKEGTQYWSTNPILEGVIQNLGGFSKKVENNLGIKNLVKVFGISTTEIKNIIDGDRPEDIEIEMLPYQEMLDKEGIRFVPTTDYQEFEDNSVRMIFANNITMHLNETQKYLFMQQMARMLSVGGVLIMKNYGTSDKYSQIEVLKKKDGGLHNIANISRNSSEQIAIGLFEDFTVSNESVFRKVILHVVRNGRLTRDQIEKLTSVVVSNKVPLDNGEELLVDDSTLQNEMLDYLRKQFPLVANIPRIDSAQLTQRRFLSLMATAVSSAVAQGAGLGKEFKLNLTPQGLIPPDELLRLFNHVDNAMRTNAQTPNPTGGIDLNPLEKQLQTSGKNDFHFTDKAMANARIDSLTPTLIGMEPLKSLSEFLGIN